MFGDKRTIKILECAYSMKEILEKTSIVRKARVNVDLLTGFSLFSPGEREMLGRPF